METLEEKETIQKLIDKIVSLPTLPDVVTKVMHLVDDPKTSAKDVNNVISKDQALAAKVLKLVNSAFYGFPQKIDTITRAVAILGFDTIKSIALSATVFDVFKGSGSVVFDREAFWKHTLAVAVASKVIAERIQLGDSETAFVAGLLHDIGKVVMDQYLHEEFIDVLTVVKKKNCSFIEAEIETIGITHAQIGRWLSLRWNMPIDLVESITNHHQPQYASEASEMTSIVHLADIVAKKMKIGYSGDSKVPAYNVHAKTILGLTNVDISEVMDDLKNSMEKADTFLSLVTN